MKEIKSDQEIIEAGYKEYPKSHLDSDGIEKNFQKRFDDNIGKKYFIDIHKWHIMTHPTTGETWGPNYEFTTQLYKKNTKEPINLKFFAGWNINTVEDYCEQLFKTGLFEYYEKWSDC